MSEAAPPAAPVEGSVQSAAPSPAPAERPSWLPEKFASPEDLAKAYTEAEKRITSLAEKVKQEAAPVTAQAPAKAQDVPPPSRQDELAVRQAGFDPAALEVEFLDTGKLSADAYAKAEKAGLTREFVDSFVQGRAALAEKQTNQLMEVVGGKETFEKVAAWAKQNLPPAELRSLNQATQNGSLELASLALRGLHARYVAANGQEPSLVGGAAGGVNEGYKSQAEVTKAMRDPRYAKDPAFRAEVERKLSANGLFTVRNVTR